MSKAKKKATVEMLVERGNPKLSGTDSEGVQPTIEEVSRATMERCKRLGCADTGMKVKWVM